MIEADSAIRANISNKLMAMSADPTQDPGVVLRLYESELRRAAFQHSRRRLVDRHARRPRGWSR